MKRIIELKVINTTVGVIAAVVLLGGCAVSMPGDSLTKKTSTHNLDEWQHTERGVAEAINPRRAIALQRVVQYDSRTLSANIKVAWLESIHKMRISRFRLEGLDAVDQDGRACEFGNTGIHIGKGGLYVHVATKLPEDGAERIIIQGRFVLNDDLIEFTAGFRKRTDAERAALNQTWEWTSVDDPWELKVSRIRY